MNNYVMSYPEFLIASLGAIYRTDPGTNSIFHVRKSQTELWILLLIFICISQVEATFSCYTVFKTDESRLSFKWHSKKNLYKNPTTLLNWP